MSEHNTTTDDERDGPPPERARTYRQYTDEEIAQALAALDANAGNMNRTARQTGIPITTLKQWATGMCRPVSAELRQRKKEQLAGSLNKLARKMFKQALKRIPDMNGRDAVIAGAVLLDKEAMLMGEATSVVEHRDDTRTAELKRRYSAVIVVDAETTPTGPPPEPLPEPSENTVNPSVSSEAGPTPSE